MKKRYLLFEALIALNPQNIIKYTRQLIANKAVISLCLVLLPFMAISQVLPVTPFLRLSSTNLVTNPSFESGATGWTANVGSPEVATSGAAYGISGASDGTRFAEVEGSVGATTLSQTITTVVGKTYLFYINGITRVGSNVGDRGFLRINGTNILSFTTTGTWQAYAATFTATSTSTIIAIVSNGSTSGLSSPTDGSGLIIDNVQIYEPDNTNSYVEGGTAVALSNTATILDGNSTNMLLATLQITNGVAGDVLSTTSLPAGITGSYNAATFTLTLSGSATTANYQTALNNVRFSSTSDNPTSTARTINVSVDDDGTAPNSNTAVATISVTPVNDPLRALIKPLLCLKMLPTPFRRLILVLATRPKAILFNR